jgi:hypothetical protein
VKKKQIEKVIKWKTLHCFLYIRMVRSSKRKDITLDFHYILPLMSSLSLSLSLSDLGARALSATISLCQFATFSLHLFSKPLQHRVRTFIFSLAHCIFLFHSLLYAQMHAGHEMALYLFILIPLRARFLFYEFYTHF